MLTITPYFHRFSELTSQFLLQAESTMFSNILMPITGLYLTGTILYIAYFITLRELTVKAAKIIMFPGLVAHAWFLYRLGIMESRFPMATVYEAMSFFVLFLILIYIYLEYTTKNKTIGAFVFPIVMLFQTISALNLEITSVDQTLFKSTLFGVHTFTAIVGYSAFVFSMILGVMYLSMFYEIKKRRFIFMYDRLPPLEMLDSMNSKSQVIGFIFLTIGILTGVIWAKRAWTDFSFFDIKILLSWFLWLLYLGSIIGRKLFGWKGRRTAYLSIAGFVVLLFTFVFVSLIFSSIHNF